MSHGTFDDLSFAEQVLLLAWRRRAARGAGDACVHAAWRIAAGDDAGGRCLDLFARLAARLDEHLRRPLVLGAAHAGRLTRDERCLLDLVSACQWDAPHLAVPLSRWLVRAPEHVAVLAIAAGLGHVMEAAGLGLPAPAALRAAGTPSDTLDPRLPQNPPAAARADRHLSTDTRLISGDSP